MRPSCGFCWRGWFLGRLLRDGVGWRESRTVGTLTPVPSPIPSRPLGEGRPRPSPQHEPRCVPPLPRWMGGRWERGARGVRVQRSGTGPRSPPSAASQIICAPGDRQLPPGDRPLPPGDRQLPPGDRPLPLGDRQLPPGDRPLPPGDRPLPPGGRQLPPGGRQLPLGDRPLPLGDRQLPPGDRRSSILNPEESGSRKEVRKTFRKRFQPTRQKAGSPPKQTAGPLPDRRPEERSALPDPSGSQGSPSG